MWMQSGQAGRALCNAQSAVHFVLPQRTPCILSFLFAEPLLCGATLKWTAICSFSKTLKAAKVSAVFQGSCLREAGAAHSALRNPIRNQVSGTSCKCHGSPG